MKVFLVFLSLLSLTCVQGDPCSEMIGHINSLRANHRDTPPLKCNNQLTDRVQKYIDDIGGGGQSKDFELETSRFNNLTGPFGMNVYFAQVFEGQSSEAQRQIDAVDSWYGQETCYDYRIPILTVCKDECKQMMNLNGKNHQLCTIVPTQFSQLVWKNTTEVGIGSKTIPAGPDNWFFLAALFSPAGNDVIDISGNVMPRI